MWLSIPVVQQALILLIVLLMTACGNKCESSKRAVFKSWRFLGEDWRYAKALSRASHISFTWKTTPTIRKTGTLQKKRFMFAYNITLYSLQDCHICSPVVKFKHWQLRNYFLIKYTWFKILSHPPLTPPENFILWLSFSR